jgi:hypothetical protein
LTLTIKSHNAASSDGTKKIVKFLTANILLPPKKAVMKQLGIPLGPGEDSGTGEVKRLAECDVSVTCSLRIGGGLNLS